MILNKLSARPHQPKPVVAASLPTDPPFDATALDGLMATVGVHILLATQRHNVCYLLGGRRFFFFAGDDAYGPSRPPGAGYKRGRAGASHYIGFMIEGYQDAHERLWVPSVANVSHGSRDAVEHTIRHIEAEEAGVAAIGIERSFLPMDAYEALRAGLHGVRFVDCTEMLEEQRERKRDDELVAKLATAMGEHHQSALAALLFDEPGTDGGSGMSTGAAARREPITG